MSSDTRPRRSGTSIGQRLPRKSGPVFLSIITGLRDLRERVARDSRARAGSKCDRRDARWHDRRVESLRDALLAVMDRKHHWAYASLTRPGLTRAQLLAH